MRQHSAFSILIGLSLVMLTACDSMPGWLGGGNAEVKLAPGNRVDVVINPESLKADTTAQDVEVEVPDQANLDQWQTINQAMLTGHIGLTGLSHEQSVTVGDGNGFSRSIVSSPVVAEGMVYAMDAAGIVSAHDESDISKVKWTESASLTSHVNDVIGGGLAYESGTVYATIGLGKLRAIDAVTGKMKWSISVGAPVRGAPAVSGTFVVVLTADNQTLAYDTATGQPRWEHRGIRESAGYFSTTAPVIGDGIVISAYSSGEVFALRLETGNVLWSDTLTSAVRTKAAAVFSGIDADPIVQSGVAVVTNASGEMQASALINGRPLWQQRLGTHSTPWSAGNVIYVLTDTHDVAALLKRDGSVRWSTSLKETDESDTTKDKTPPLYGPILSANALLVIDGDGKLTSFKPTTGEVIGHVDLEEGIVTNPIVVNGALYVMTKDATLHRYH